MKRNRASQVASLGLLARTIRRELPVLTEFPSLLPSHLYTTLLIDAGPTEAGPLLEAATAALDRRPWLRLSRRPQVRRPWLQAVLSHDGVDVTAVGYSPDGSTVATGVEERVDFWDPATGSRLQSWSSAHGGVDSLAWSPLGDVVAVGCASGTIAFLDPRSMSEFTSFEAHGDSVVALKWQPGDASLLASGSFDSRVRVWDREAQLIHDLGGTSDAHHERVWALSWSPDGRRIASVSSDDSLRVWRLEPGPVALERRWDAPRPPEGIAAAGSLAGQATSGVYAVAWSPDGKLLASGGWDGNIRLIDVISQKNTAVLSGHAMYITDLAWSPDGDLLASAAADQTIRVWNRSGEQRVVLSGHRSVIYALSWRPDGATLASASGDATVRLWEIGDREASTQQSGHPQALTACEWATDHTKLASSSAQDIRAWDSDGCLRWDRPVTGIVCTLDWAPDGSVVACGLLDKKSSVRLWDTGDGSPAGHIAQDGFVVALRWSADGSMLAWLEGNGNVCLLDRHKGVIISPPPMRPADPGVPLDETDGGWGFTLADGDGNPLSHLMSAVSPLAWSAGADLLAVVAATGHVQVLTRTGRRVFEPCAGTWPLTWSSNETLLAYQGPGHSVHVIDGSGQQLADLTGHDARVCSLAWSPDGRHLASGDVAGGVRIWELTRTHGERLEGHMDGVAAIAWSPDGECLFTGDRRGFVRACRLGSTGPAATAICLSAIETLWYSDADDQIVVTDTGESTDNQPAIYWFKIAPSMTVLPVTEGPASQA